MARIEGPSVEACFLAETVRFLALLGAVVARLAKALQRAGVELVRVAAVPLDMVGDRRGYCLAALQVKGAKRLGG